LSSYFSLPNPHSSIRTRTRKEEALIEELEQQNEQAKFYNSSKANEKVPNGPLKRYCPLDENPLKPIKSKKLEDLDIELPRFRCVLCKSVFQGYGFYLFHETKKDLEAIVFPFDGTL